MATTDWGSAQLSRTTLLSDTHVVASMRLTDRYIIVGLDHGEIHVLDIDGDGHRIFEGHTGGVWAIEVLQGILISASTDKSIKLWDLGSGACLNTLQGHTNTVRQLGITSSKKLVSGSRDHTLRIWDLETGACEYILEGHTNNVRSVSVHKDLVASGSYDCTARLWDTATGRLLQTFVGHTQKIYAIAFDGQRVVTGSMDNIIRVWDPNDGNCLAVLTGHRSLVSLLKLAGDTLLSGGADGILIAWSLSEYTETRRFIDGGCAITALSYSHPWIVSGNCDSKGNVQDGTSGAESLYTPLTNHMKRSGRSRCETKSWPSP